jgi:hypothetical protein
MVEIRDAEGEGDTDVEVVMVVVVEGDEEVLAPRLQTICKTRKWQEAVEEWHIQG